MPEQLPTKEQEPKNKGKKEELEFEEKILEAIIGVCTKIYGFVKRVTAHKPKTPEVKWEYGEDVPVDTARGVNTSEK